jgi:hypothetical protein
VRNAHRQLIDTGWDAPILGRIDELARWLPVMTRTGLDASTEEATVDPYNDHEQITDLFTMLDEHLAVPFDTELLGTTVTVKKIDPTVEHAIVAIRAMTVTSRRKISRAQPDLLEPSVQTSSSSSSPPVGVRPRAWSHSSNIGSVSRALPCSSMTSAFETRLSSARPILERLIPTAAAVSSL